jgi:serine/threonine-protein kinase
MKKLQFKLLVVLINVACFANAQFVSTYAGALAKGSANGTGTAARFYYPAGLAVDSSGNMYVVDQSNNEIRKIVISSRVVSTIAGNGAKGSANGIGAAASFNLPTGVAVYGGNLYIADENNNEIRKIVIATGVVTTFAGSITPGSKDGSDTAARFYVPFAICADGIGDLFVADASNNEIRKIVIATGVVTTFAGSVTAGSKDGNDTAARFNGPIGIATDYKGNLYVADQFNNEIRKIVISTGAVTTFAGSTTPDSVDGIGMAAGFNNPYGITADGNGNLYVLDGNNNEVRKIVIATAQVTTYAGTTSAGSANGLGTLARFNGPVAAVTVGSTIYVADQTNNEIRKIIAPPIAYFKANITTVCANTPVQFTDTSYNSPTAWNWTFQNGTPATSTVQNPTVVFSGAGTDSVKLVVTNAAGADSVTKTAYITVRSVPTVSISGDTSLCKGPDLLTATPAGNAPFTYSWNTTGTHDTVMVTVAKTYSVTVTDVNGCVGKGTYVVKTDSVPLVQICVVSVDTGSTHNVVVWDKTGVTRIDSFKLYFMNSASKWQLIKAVPFSAPGYIVDTTSIDDPNKGTVRYCLTGVDSCGSEEHFAASPWQNTTYIINNGSGTFSWSGTGYLKKGVAQPVLTYYMYRDSLSNGNWKLIDSVSGTQNTRTDPAYASYPKARWRIDALLNDSVSSGCTVPVLRPIKAKTYNTSHSNTANTTTVTKVTSISSSSPNSILIYPNPSNGVFTIDVKGIGDKEYVEVYNVLGEKVYSIIANSYQLIANSYIEINISNQSSGVYFVKVTTSTSSQVVKLVKE